MPKRLARSTWTYAGFDSRLSEAFAEIVVPATMQRFSQREIADRCRADYQPMLGLSQNELPYYYLRVLVWCLTRLYAKGGKRVS